MFVSLVVLRVSSSTLFPYTTLFRSPALGLGEDGQRVAGRAGRGERRREQRLVPFRPTPRRLVAHLGRVVFKFNVKRVFAPLYAEPQPEAIRCADGVEWSQAELRDALA